jgi:hypothetical protein
MDSATTSPGWINCDVRYLVFMVMPRAIGPQVANTEFMCMLWPNIKMDGEYDVFNLSELTANVKRVVREKSWKNV